MGVSFCDVSKFQFYLVSFLQKSNNTVLCMEDICKIVSKYVKGNFYNTDNGNCHLKGDIDFRKVRIKLIYW
jgi:hypothetical protein